MQRSSEQKLASARTVLWEVLRFGAPEFQIAADGFVPISVLVSHPALRLLGLTEADFIALGGDDVRGRIDVAEDVDGSVVVRALYGHSPEIPVAIIYQPLRTSSFALREVSAQKWERVKIKGLYSRRKRHIVLFTSDAVRAMTLADARNPTHAYTIFVDVQRATRDGIQFFVTPQGVILTEGIVISLRVFLC
jgi:RNA:NAD 2'-phosphotransferase (TPT1/KptA family)